MRAGIISLPVVSAAGRIHGGQVMMAQAQQDLPKGVRDALGDSPEARGMQVMGRAGTGMSSAPKHHVLPKEHREWFERRGFKGDRDIDQFCVRLGRAEHEVIHGGGTGSWGAHGPASGAGWSCTVSVTLRLAGC
ncbi:TIGR02269 family lipoprotein [Myxococcus xanthus]|uniref:TIGR02269 family lipoprotein n=1 Tax=Myxococcus xanthus TaxID=34 RepID=UPI0020A2B3C8|nr:TIGR02269 family lipoprotein [Myxococcus xanthus]